MNKKKILSLIMALVMLVGVFSPLTAMAADEKEPTKIKVNVHKILISEAALEKHDVNKKYDPTQKLDVKTFFGDKNAKEINGVYFVAIKSDDKAGYADFDTKTREEQDEILKAIPADRQGVTKNVEGTDGVIQFNLDNPGNYKIYEVKHKSTYKGPNGEVLTGMKAIPVDLKLPDHARTEAGVQSEIHVYPKNSEKKIQFDKNFKANNDYEKIKDDNNLIKTGADVDKYNQEKAEAKAFIGKEIEYESLAKLPKGSVFTKLDLEDSMDKGLKYKSADGVTVTVTPQLTNALEKEKDYKITDASNGFKLEFTQTGLDKLNEAAKANELSIKFTYKATVTAEAINDQPMDNHITLRYNHEPPTPSSEKVTPKEGKIKVSKTWVDAENKALNAPAGARVTYMLLDENDKPVADVTFTAAKTVDSTDLGNGIKFEVTGDFAGTFSGLKGTGYKVKEIVDGYEPEYTVNNTDGSVAVKNKKTPNSITPTPPKVTVGGKRFVKVGEKDARLAGAEFVIQNKNTNDKTNNNKYLKINGTGNEDAYIKAEKAYNDAIQAVNEALKKGDISDKNTVTIEGVAEPYKTKETAMAKVAELENARNEAFVNATLTYTWVDSKDDATKFNTNEYGQFEVSGLAYGDYSAIETKAPAGYALPTDGGNFTFRVEKDSYKTDATPMDYKIKVGDKETTDGQGKKITNNKVTIPQTGGIGTVLFTVVGISLMAGAVMAMKKNREEA
ncbi:MAG: SpaA isopeptide-forming pilin-related protein [Peptoniphilus harei]|nr:SpaA isopeptide-forming pilin-related protein [Peptoniphilus harei]